MLWNDEFTTWFAIRVKLMAQLQSQDIQSTITWRPLLGC